MRPFGRLAIAFIAGICIAHYIHVPFFYVFSLTLIFILVTLFTVKKKYFTVFLMAATALFGCAVYIHSITLSDNHIKNFSSPGKVRLKCAVTSDIEKRVTKTGSKMTTFIVRSLSVETGGQEHPVRGHVKVYVFGRTPPITYGDEIILLGNLSQAKRESYRAYLEKNNIYALLNVDSKIPILVTGKKTRSNPVKALAFYIREKTGDPISSLLPEEEASLLGAMLLGIRQGAYFDLRDPFVKTGTVHILAISGLHVGLIALILYVIFSTLRFNRKAITVLIILLLVLYALITGSRVPVVRATIMISLVLLGGFLGRRSSVFNSLGLAAIVILLVNPKQVASVGFQLSFTAVLSIIYCSPKLDRFFKVNSLLKKRHFVFKVLHYIVRLFSVSVSAWLGTSPLVLYYFNTISPVAVFGNLVVVPLTFLIIASGVSFIVFYFLLPPVGYVFAHSVAFLIDVLLFTTEKLSSVPFAYFSLGSPPVIAIILYYVLIFIFFKKRD